MPEIKNNPTPIERACEFLIRKAYPKYDKKTCGYCARFVRMAFDFGFNTRITGVTSAKDYAPSYEAIGFKKVFSYPEMKKTDYKPMLGDICIIQPVVIEKNGKKTIHQPHGHICVKTAKGWISDFVQGTGGSKLPLADMYGGPIRDKDPAFVILRFPA